MIEPTDVQARDLAWGRNAITFIRERGLEGEFNDWCGGWKCPVDTAHDEPIAWLYEKKGKQSVKFIRELWLTLPDRGWTETPLYAALTQEKASA